MNYSVKKFIKKKCKGKYKPSDLKKFADEIVEESKGRYNNKSALKILSKYAYINNNNIIFNVNNRDHTKTFEDLIESIKLDNNIKNESGDESLEPDFSDNDNNKDESDSDYSEPEELADMKKSVKLNKYKSKGGFGSIKKIDENNNLNKSNVKIKKSGFGNFSKKKVSNEVNNIKSINFDGSIYELPKEKKFSGVYRVNDSDEKYGPYGTDNYHDAVMSDKINDKEARRVDVYRKLEAKYYPPQRSDMWFEMRDKMITASDGGTVVGLNPYEYPFSFVSKKVHGKPFKTNIDCYHGKKYEEVATMAYEYRMNVRVREFGLCQHPEYDFLGASPDGIVCEFKLHTKDGRTWKEIEKEFTDLLDLPINGSEEEILRIKKENKKIAKKNRKIAEKYGVKTKYVGRMLEIKCPLRRKILMDKNAPEVYGPYGETIKDLKKDVKKGVCPAYYWVQVQLQLQCCDLDECDFWQCEIQEYPDKEYFIEDTEPEHPWLSRSYKHEKGAVIQLMPIDKLNDISMEYKERIYNFAEFIYMPKVDMTPAEVDIWINETISNISDTHPGKVFERVLYWKITNTRNITIKRDDKWFKDNLEKFRQIWEYVKYYRGNIENSKLFKRYLDSIPRDYYGNFKKTYSNDIHNTMIKIYNEPDKNSSSNYKKYKKFVNELDKKLIKDGYVEPPEYNGKEDLNFIKKSLKINIPDDITDKERKKFIEKYKNLLDSIKQNINNFLFEE